MGLTLATAVVLGVTPALRATRTDLASSIREGARHASSGSSRRRWLDALIVAEIALATLLLSGSAVLARSFIGLIGIDTGFEASNVLTMTLPVQGFPPGSRYASPEEFKAHLRQVQASIAALPGVRDAALTNALPLTDCCLYGLSMQIENRPVADRANRGGGLFKVVTPSYFTTLGLTLRRGRFLDERDIAGAVPAIVINERLAAQYFPDEDPIGRHIANPAIVPGKTERGADISWEIVGVVGNEKISALNDDTSAVLYATYEQSPVYFTNLVVRGSLDAAALEKSVRAALFAIDQNQGIRDVRTLEQIKSTSVGGDRFQTLLATIFSGVALLLAAIGIYGVLVVLRRAARARARRPRSARRVGSEAVAARARARRGPHAARARTRARRGARGAAVAAVDSLSRGRAGSGSARRCRCDPRRRRSRRMRRTRAPRRRRRPDDRSQE